MAVNQNQSYTETLREMRTTRMQQLRQGNSQSQLMSRQTAVLSSMNNMLTKQSQMMNRLESSQRASNQQLVSVNRNLTSLSTTLSRSLSNFAATVARGAGSGVRAVGGAVAGTTGAVAGTTGAIATSIASGIGKVLPVAIAGYVVKSISWDNMSQETQDKITGSMGNLFDKAMKEIDSTEIGNSLTKALTPAFDQLKSLTKKLGEEIDVVKSKLPTASQARETVVNTAQNTAQNVRDTVASPRVQRETTRAGIIAEDIGGVAKSAATTAYETGKAIYQNPGSVVSTAQNVLLGVGTAGIALGTYELTKPAQGRGGGVKMSSASQKAVQALRSEGSKVTKINIALARTAQSMAASSGPAGKFVMGLKKTKLKYPAMFGPILEAGMYYWLSTEIDAMLKLGELTKEEADFLKSDAQRAAAFRMGGGTIGSATAAVAAGGTTVGTGGIGALFATSMVLGGGYVGSKAGEKIHELTRDKGPASLYEEIKPGGKTQDVINRRQSKFESPAVAGEKPQANATPDVRDLPYGDENAYREVVGKTEGGALGYDAVFGAYNKSDMEKYMKTQASGGKKVSEMTIEEALVFASSRGANKGALGKYQFMPDTLKGLYPKAGLKKTDLFNAENQDKLFYKFTELNGEYLKKAGVKVSPFTLRLAHALGAGGAVKILKADPNAVPADVFGYKKGSAAYETNPQLWKNGVTVSSYLKRMEKQLGGSGSTMLASNNPPPAVTTKTETIPQASKISVAADATSTSAPAAAVTPTDGVVKDQTAWGGITAVAEKGKEKVAEMVESLEEKRKRSIAEMFSSTLASLNPESLKSDLLEKLEIAKSVMIGKGESGGTTINNIDNSSTNSQSGGGSTSKSVYPDNVRSNVDHATTMWGGRIT